ncbi:olfactory receptor 1f45-like [Pelodytes ibericus]
MEYSNQSSVRQFILLGLSTVPYLRAIDFFLFLLMYLFTLLGNGLLIALVGINSKLQTPMYFFLINLSVIDIGISSTIIPKILVNTLARDKSISFLGCASQTYFHLALGKTECFILAVMAFDRYAAICKNLRYRTIMDRKVCLWLGIGSWTISFLNAIIHVVSIFQLPFCRSTHVNHYFCEMPPLFKLSCTDTSLIELGVFIAGGLNVLCAFVLILTSYVHIISSILKISSKTGRNKTFSTCGSHLTVVTIFYGTIMFMYLRPRSSYSPRRDRMVSIIYTVVNPLLNPIIYSIRNKEVKDTLRKALTLNDYTK